MLDQVPDSKSFWNPLPNIYKSFLFLLIMLSPTMAQKLGGSSKPIYTKPKATKQILQTAALQHASQLELFADQALPEKNLQPLAAKHQKQNWKDKANKHTYSRKAALEKGEGLQITKHAHFENSAPIKNAKPIKLQTRNKIKTCGDTSDLKRVFAKHCWKH